MKYKQQPPLSPTIKDISLEDVPSHPNASTYYLYLYICPNPIASLIYTIIYTLTLYSLVEIIALAKRFGPKLQLNSPGYLPNKRQQAACGLAILELAQRLKGNP